MAHILAVDEPSLRPLPCRRRKREGVAAAKRVMTAFGLATQARFHPCDPFHDLRESTFAATDALVAVRRAVHRRDGLPLAMTKTSCHRGHRNANRRFPRIGDGRHAWVRHIPAEVAASGVPVQGTCRYPWLGRPVRGRPGMRSRWSRGWPGRLEPQAAA